MELWDIIFYTTESGKSPVEEFLRMLPALAEANVSRDILRLAINGLQLGEPLLKKIDHDLWELRTIGADIRVRILLSQEGEEIVLLHAVKKQQQKLLRQDIETAHRRLRDYRERF